MCVYLFLVKILKRRSQTRCWRQMVRQMVRLTCSYQHAMDPPNAIGGHTRRGATFRITYCAAAPAPAADTVSGTGKYGCTTSSHDQITSVSQSVFPDQ